MGARLLGDLIDYGKPEARRPASRAARSYKTTAASMAARPASGVNFRPACTTSARRSSVSSR